MSKKSAGIGPPEKRQLTQCCCFSFEFFSRMEKKRLRKCSTCQENLNLFSRLSILVASFVSPHLCVTRHESLNEMVKWPWRVSTKLGAAADQSRKSFSFLFFPKFSVLSGPFISTSRTGRVSSQWTDRQANGHTY
jgi:hypothetical protein